MARLWKAFVLVVALAAVACEAISQSRYEEDIVNQAIEAYNKGRPGMPLFRLVDYTMLSFVDSTNSASLEFRIKETECISFLDSQHQNCSFLEDGEERNCIGQFLRRWWSICDRDCSGEAAPLYSYPDYPVEDVPVDG